MCMYSLQEREDPSTRGKMYVVGILPAGFCWVVEYYDNTNEATNISYCMDINKLTCGNSPVRGNVDLFYRVEHGLSPPGGGRGECQTRLNKTTRYPLLLYHGGARVCSRIHHSPDKP